MVREFNLPRQPVSKRKIREPTLAQKFIVLFHFKSTVTPFTANSEVAFKQIFFTINIWYYYYNI